MNTPLDIICTRRSIRLYTDQSIDDQSIDQILRAGMAAPSAYNGQPWHFIVVTERDTLVDLTKIHPYAQMAKSAPLAILVCADKTPPKKGANAYWPQDCAAACQNMLLAAHGMGIGSVWTGVYPNPERGPLFKQYFTLPDHIEPFALLIFGYPNQSSPSVDRYDKTKIHQNKW